MVPSQMIAQWLRLSVAVCRASWKDDLLGGARQLSTVLMSKRRLTGIPSGLLFPGTRSINKAICLYCALEGLSWSRTEHLSL